MSNFKPKHKAQSPKPQIPKPGLWPINLKSQAPNSKPLPNQTPFQTPKTSYLKMIRPWFQDISVRVVQSSGQVAVMSQCIPKDSCCYTEIGNENKSIKKIMQHMFSPNGLFGLIIPMNYIKLQQIYNTCPNPSL